MRRPARGEEGGALILALVFLLVVALFVMPMVTFLDVGQRTTVPLRDARSRAFAADAAMDAAIARFRSAGCDDHLAPARDDSTAVGGQEMLVRCSAAGGGGSVATPEHALLALGGRGDEDGVTSTAGNLRVRGSVFSHSTRVGPGGGSVHVAGSGNLMVDGRVSALGDCEPRAKVLATQGRQCTNDPGPDGAANPVRGRDPDYLRSMRAVPAPGAVTEGEPPVPVAVPSPLPDPPTCPAAGWLVDVWPGYYDDATLFNLLTGGACPGRAVWFHPGDYHFNFGFRGGATTWTVGDPTVNVVGGTAKGDWPEQAAKPVPFPLPDACRGDDDPGEGVQFVLGGASRLDVQRGKVELCASFSPNDQRIALYGDPGPRDTHELAPATTVENDGFADPANALLTGEVGPVGWAKAELDATSTEASMTVGSFRPFVPRNAVVDSALLHVVHRDEGAMGGVSVSLSAPGCGGPKALPLRPDGLVEDVVDLGAECGWAGRPGIPSLGRACASEPSTPPENGDCLTVEYLATASGAGAATATLDGIWIEVAYREPVTRKPGGWVAPATGDLFTDRANALQIGERPTALTADAGLTPAEPTASITLAGYGEPPVQPGSTIDHAVLRVAHHETGDVASVEVAVSGACGTPSPPQTTVGPTAHTDTVDLKACLTTADLADLTVTFTATLDGAGAGGTAHLDGIWLDLLVSPPATYARAINHDDGAGGFTTLPGNVLAIDGNSATTTLTTAAPAAVMAIGEPDGFGLSLPRGAVPEAAFLRIAHQQVSPELVPLLVSIRVSDDGGLTSDCVPEQNIPYNPGPVATWVAQLPPGCDLSDPSQLRVAYGVALGPGGTSATGYLDGIELDLRYQPAAVRRPAAHDDGVGGFTDTDRALSVNGENAFAVLDAAADPPRTQASVTVTGFGLPMPAGSRLDSALMRVAYQDDTADAVPLTLTVRASVDGGATYCVEKTLTTSPGQLAFDTTDLLVAACDLSDPGALAVTFTAALGEGGTGGVAAVDGVEVDLRFTPPSFEAVAGCAAQGPYPPADPPGDIPGCALVKVSPGASPDFTRLVVQGTVYAPTGAVDIALSNVTAPFVTRGIAARTIRLGIIPATTRALISVPPESAVLTVHWARSLRAATATDGSGFAAAPDAGRRIDGALTRGTVDGAGADASLRLSDFGPPSATWADPPILRVRHEDGAGVSQVRVVVTLANGDLVTFSSADVPCELCLAPGVTVEDHLVLDEYDDDTDPLTAPVPITPALLDGATVEFLVVGSPGAVADVDGMEIVEVTSGPRLRAQVEFPPDDPTAIVAWTVLP